MKVFSFGSLLSFYHSLKTIIAGIISVLRWQANPQPAEQLREIADSQTLFVVRHPQLRRQNAFLGSLPPEFHLQAIHNPKRNYKRGNTLTKEMQQYLASSKNNANFTLIQAKASDDLPLGDEKLCTIGLQLMEKPVRIKGSARQVFDYENLMRLTSDSLGGRKHPILRTTFYLPDIEPALDLKEKIDEYLQTYCASACKPHITSANSNDTLLFQAGRRSVPERSPLNLTRGALLLSFISHFKKVHYKVCYFFFGNFYASFKSFTP